MISMKCETKSTKNLEIFDEYDAEDLDEEIVEISYPVESVPEKISSLGFDKKPVIEGTLTGIKDSTDS